MGSEVLWSDALKFQGCGSDLMSLSKRKITCTEGITVMLVLGKKSKLLLSAPLTDKNG